MAGIHAARRRFLAVALGLLAAMPVGAQPEIDWTLGLEARHFPQSGSLGQSQGGASASLSTEWRWDYEGDQRVLFAPYLRLDSEDDRRTHGDLRELYWRKNFARATLYAGVRRVFWGATEALHLVDIVNQTDLVENPDGEDKLGQPMIQLTLNQAQGNLDLFLLAGFRERTFPSTRGRLGLGLPIDRGASIYESSKGRDRVDWALRWFRFLGPVEFGISHFSGTAREPVFEPRFGPAGVALVPRYELLEQSALDLTAVSNAWLWKLELASRRQNGARSTAMTGGFEWTRFGIAQGKFDLGLIVEYQFDDRRDGFAVAAQNDAVAGFRLGANDTASSELLFLASVDLDGEGNFFSVEASRRLGSRYRLSLEGRWFDSATDAPLAFLNREDYLQLELLAFF